MCFFDKPPPPPAPPPTPVRTSADIQRDQEKERLKTPYSTLGFAASILTSGLGDTSTPTVRGVTLGSG